MTLHPDGGSVIEDDINPALIPDQTQRIAMANKHKAEVLRLINVMKARGNTSLVGLARELNNRGIPAPRGGLWTAVQVSRVL